MYNNYYAVSFGNLWLYIIYVNRQLNSIKLSCKETISKLFNNIYYFCMYLFDR